MMRTPYLGILLAAVLFGCGRGEDFSQAEKNVRAQLKDPDSAQFSQEFETENHATVCGLVNAKNSFGGYVGSRRFFSIAGFAMIEPDDNDPLRQVFEKTWASSGCKLGD